MKKTTQFLLLALAFVFSSSAFAQSRVTGTVMDSELNAPLPGANILEKGTSNGASSDFDGNFTLTTTASSGEIVISYVGYGSVTLSFNGDTNLGTITLSPDNSLEEIVLVGTGIIDLAGDRQTPVAVSTIQAAEIQDKIGTQDVTMTLVNTPSVYVAGAAGGYGDSRISVRGFDQSNTAYLLNGQPINGMEDGRMYWSNWSGISDIASVVQMQRGLGSSKLAISSVGGTVNFVTKTTDKRESGFAYVGVANDDYLKTTYQYSTGKSEKGWGASFMLSHWQGDGYNEGNFGAGETYFLSVGYTPNDTHNFNFLITGAPQFHDQNFSKRISSYLEYGKRYNNNWGMYGSQYLTERRNFYHKPVANLNWDYTISDDTKLSTVLYASWGRGGGTGGRGSRPRTATGHIDYNAIYAFNNNVANGAGGYFTAGGGYITRASMNLHNWYGLVSNLETKLGENITFNIGMDLRTYYGKHFRIVENFHGLTSWKENIRLRDPNDNHNTYGSFGTYKFVETTRDMSANPWTIAFADFDEDEKIAYSNDERITYGGLFTQLEYAEDRFSAFFQGAISTQAHQRFDHYQYADQSLINGTSSQWTGTPLPAGIRDGVDSEKVNNFGYNVKGGVGFRFDDEGRHKAYANAGFYSRQPFHDNIFNVFTNKINTYAENEEIFGLEFGYAYSSPNFSANIDLYRTNWGGRVDGVTNDVGGVLITTLNYGQEQTHKGIELSFTGKLQENFDVRGFVSLGDWTYVGSVIQQERDEEQNVGDETIVDVDGGKVGDAAQTTFGIGFDWDVCDNFSIDSDTRLYKDLYANVGAVKNNLKLPSFGLTDLGASYRMYVGKDLDKSIHIRGNVNNLLNKEYISELRTNIRSGESGAGAGEYEGINIANQGYFGWGRTWNVSVRYKF